jgi:RNA polymerase sigma factor (TIGR02999 family)
MSTDEQVTQWLLDASEGDSAAMEEVAAWAYEHLERAARRQMQLRFGGNLNGLTLEPAALVNETFLKLAREPRQFANRKHFYSFASTVMLRALADYARRRSAAKRGGDAVKVTLSDVHVQPVEPSRLRELLDELQELDTRKADVVLLRTLWGASMSEVADILEISLATAERDWRFAKAWLVTRLEGSS